MPSPGEEHEALLGHGPQGINPDCAPHEPCFLSGGSRQDGNQKKVQTKLVIALVLCIIFMIVEVVGGYLAHSVAILADAAHMLSDAAGFGISLFAAWAVTRRSHKDYSFGYHRAETIGALLGTLTIWAVTGALVWEAIQRILDPQPVDGKLMFIVATAGIVFNLVVGAVLGHHHHHGHAHDHDHDHDHAHDHGPAPPSHSSYHHPTPTPPTVLSNPSGAEGEKGQVAGGPPGDAPEHGLPSDAAQIPVSKPLFSSPEAEAKMMGPGAATGGGGGGGDAGAGAVGAGKGSQGSDKTCAGHDGHGHQPSAPAHSYDHDHDHDHGHGHGRGEGIERRENLNLRSAMLHVIGDLVQSMGVALAGLLIWYKQDDPRWALADPICTFIFAILVLLTTRGIIIDIVHILMERTPTQHDLAEMYETMLEMNGVHDVHDLHVWNLSLGIPILSAHVNMDADGQPDSVLKKLQQFARSRGIRHSTIQICNPANPLPPSMRPGPRQV